MTREKMSIMAIIPAKGASKRLPRKNLIDFFGKPLMQYTIEAAIKSEVFNKIVVCSEDMEVLEKTSNIPGIEVIERPYRLAIDPATVMDVCNYVLDQIRENYEYVFILLPTTPLRDDIDIRNAYKLLYAHRPDALISVAKFPYEIKFTFFIDEKNILHRLWTNKNLRDLKMVNDCVADNGGIYALRPMYIREKEYCPSNTIPYIMPFWRSIDVDTEENLELAKAMYNYFIIKNAP